MLSSFNARMTNMINNEQINESKRQGKLYSYLDTIKGAGKYMNLKTHKSGGGKIGTWTNWVTSNNDYNQDMAKRALALIRTGITKESELTPTPNISDTMKLLEINKLFDGLKSLIMAFNEQSESFDIRQNIYNKNRSKQIIKEYEGKPNISQKKYEKALKIKEHYDTIGKRAPKNVDIIGETYPQMEQLYSQTLMDVNKNNETFQIINKYNSLVNYLNQVIGYNKLNQSDKNKIDDKFTELIPMLQETVENADYLEIGNSQQLKLMLSRIINKNYKPIAYSDLVDVDESQIPNSGYIDVSGNTRDAGDILFGLDEDEDQEEKQDIDEYFERDPNEWTPELSRIYNPDTREGQNIEIKTRKITDIYNYINRLKKMRMVPEVKAEIKKYENIFNSEKRKLQNLRNLLASRPRPRPNFDMMPPPTFSTDTGLPSSNADLLPMYQADDMAEPGRYPYVIPGDIDDEERKEAPTERQLKIRELQEKITNYEPTVTTDTHRRKLLRLKEKLNKLKEEEDATAIQGKGKHRGRPKLIKINKFNGTQNDSIYDILKNYAMPQLNFSLTTEAMDKKNDILYKKKK